MKRIIFSILSVVALNIATFSWAAEAADDGISTEIGTKKIPTPAPAKDSCGKTVDECQKKVDELALQVKQITTAYQAARQQRDSAQQALGDSQIATYVQQQAPAPAPAPEATKK